MRYHFNTISPLLRISVREQHRLRNRITSSTIYLNTFLPSPVFSLTIFIYLSIIFSDADVSGCLHSFFRLLFQSFCVRCWSISLRITPRLIILIISSFLLYLPPYQFLWPFPDFILNQPSTIVEGFSFVYSAITPHIEIGEKRKK